MRPEVLIFVQEGCPACAELEPIAKRVAAHHALCVSTRFVDVGSEEELANQMDISETPTAIGINVQRQPIVRMVGHDGNAERLVKVYQTVIATMTSCGVGPFHDL